MRSTHPPERLAVELQSRLAPGLSQKGYRVVSYGPGGITWRRGMQGKVILGLAVLGLLALGGLASGEAGSIIFGVVCGIAAGLLAYHRRPATMTIGLTLTSGGTDVSVNGGPDAPRARELARTVAGPSPDSPESSGYCASQSDDLAPSIARLVLEARARHARIAAAIRRAELPYDEVAEEVAGIVTAIERTARRAQLLHEALEDTPSARVAERLAQVQDAADGDSQLAHALTTQLEMLERMARQLGRFHAELERMLVELDTVRSQIVSLSASSETSEQDRLAGEVRALRERIGAISDAVGSAYGPSGT